MGPAGGSLSFIASLFIQNFSMAGGIWFLEMLCRRVSTVPTNLHVLSVARTLCSSRSHRRAAHYLLLHGVTRLPYYSMLKRDIFR